MADHLNKQLNRNTLFIALPIVVWACFVWSSASMPFIPSQEYISFLTYGLYPAILAFFMYVVFIKKEPKTGLTGYQLAINQQITKAGKLKTKVLTPFAVIFGLAVMMYTVMWYPAWPSSFQVSPEQTLIGKVIDLKKLRKSGRTKIYLRTSDQIKSHVLHWPTVKSQHIDVGSQLTLQVNKNWFGYYVHDLKVTGQ